MSEDSFRPDADADADTPPEQPAARPFGNVNLFFRLAAGLVALFVVTIFALIATMLGVRPHPLPGCSTDTACN